MKIIEIIPPLFKKRGITPHPYREYNRSLYVIDWKNMKLLTLFVKAHGETPWEFTKRHK